jgi:hypothetical protein
MVSIMGVQDSPISSSESDEEEVDLGPSDKDIDQGGGTHDNGDAECLYCSTKVKMGYNVSRAASGHTECVHSEIEQFILQQVIIVSKMCSDY